MASGRPSPNQRSNASCLVSTYPCAINSAAKCGRPTEPSALDITAWRSISRPCSLASATIRSIRGPRLSPRGSSHVLNDARWPAVTEPSGKYASKCHEVGARSRPHSSISDGTTGKPGLQVISTPGMKLMPSWRAAAAAVSHPAIVSWSVNDQCMTPEAAINCATFSTECSPSLFVEWL